MSPMNYCLHIQAGVKKAKPAKDDPAFRDWFGDTGRASRAVTHTLEGKDGRGLAIAEKLAEKYHILA